MGEGLNIYMAQGWAGLGGRTPVIGVERALALAADLAACLEELDGSLWDQHRTAMDDAYLASPPADRAVAMAALAHPSFGKHEVAAMFCYTVGGVSELERFCSVADLVLGHRDFLLWVVQATFHAPDVARLLTAAHDPEGLFEHEWTPEEYGLVLRRRPDAAPLLWRRLLEEASTLDERRCLSLLDSPISVFDHPVLKATFLRAAALCDVGFFHDERPAGASWASQLLACPSAAPFWAVGVALADRAPALARRLADVSLPLEMALGKTAPWTSGSRRNAFLAAAARVMAILDASEALAARRFPEYPPTDCPAPPDGSPRTGDHGIVVGTLCAHGLEEPRA